MNKNGMTLADMSFGFANGSLSVCGWRVQARKEGAIEEERKYECQHEMTSLPFSGGRERERVKKMTTGNGRGGRRGKKVSRVSMCKS